MNAMEHDGTQGDGAMTTAEKISALLHDDGQCWKTDDGRSFADLVDEYRASESWRDGHRTGDVVRYTFDDGSVLTEAGDGWDFGYPDCYCWEGVGHDDNCTARVEA